MTPCAKLCFYIFDKYDRGEKTQKIAPDTHEGFYARSMLQAHFERSVHTRGHTAGACSMLWYTRGSKRKKLGVGARVKGSKGIVGGNNAQFDWLMCNICRINRRATKSVSTHEGAFSSSLNLPRELAPKYLTG